MIIGHTFPEPNTTAAGTRMMQLISLFQEMEFNIYFGATASKTEFSQDLESLGLTSLSIQLNHSSFDEKLRAIQPDLVLYDRFMMEEQFGWRVREQCPQALTILDTEDLHFLRKAREKAFNQNQPVNLFTDETKRELASILRCDLSLIISEAEIRLLSETFSVPTEQLYYLPLFYETSSKPLKLGFQERAHFVILGNFMHAPNSDAVRWLKHSIWPEIKAQLPNAECHVYGAYIPKNIQSFHNSKEGFLIKGWAEDKEAILQRAKIVLAPLRFGAGLKGKVMDGMAMGTPVVTTGIGAEGILGSYPYEGLSEQHDGDLVAKAIHLYSNEALWSQTQQQGFDILENRFLRTIFDTAFSDKVNELMENLLAHRKKHFMGQILHHESLQSKKFMSKWIELKNKT